MPDYQLHHIHHEAADVDVAARFYVDNFDAEVTERSVSEGGWQSARVRLGNLQINITDRAEHDVGLRSYRGLDHMGIHTSDFDATVATLRNNGVNFFIEPFSPRDGLQVAFVSGPDDIKIEVLQVGDA